MKVWLDKKSTIVVASKTVRYGDKFDEKLLHSGILKVLSENGSIGEKVVTEKEIQKLAENAVNAKLTEKFEKEIEKLKSDHGKEVEKLKATIADLKKGSK